SLRFLHMNHTITPSRSAAGLSVLVPNPCRERSDTKSRPIGQDSLLARVRAVDLLDQGVDPCDGRSVSLDINPRSGLLHVTLPLNARPRSPLPRWAYRIAPGVPTPQGVCRYEKGPSPDTPGTGLIVTSQGKHPKRSSHQPNQQPT